MTDQLQSFDDLYPGRFLKAGNLHGQPQTFTIKSIDREELEGDKGLEPKIVLHFKETPMALVLPKVNAVCLKAMFGPQVIEWVGKRVTLYATTAIMPLPTRKNEPCIRVYGSPDIAEPVRCEWTPPRRRPIVQTLQPVKLEAEAAPAKPEPASIAPAASKAIAEAPTVDALARIMLRVAAHFDAGHITAEEKETLVKAARAREDVLQPPAKAEPAPPTSPSPAKKTVIAAFDALPPQKRKQARDQFFARFPDITPGTIVSGVTTDDHVSALAEIIAAAGD